MHTELFNHNYFSFIGRRLVFQGPREAADVTTQRSTEAPAAMTSGEANRKAQEAVQSYQAVMNRLLKSDDPKLQSKGRWMKASLEKYGTQATIDRLMDKGNLATSLAQAIAENFPAMLKRIAGEDASTQAEPKAEPKAEPVAEQKPIPAPESTYEGGRKSVETSKPVATANFELGLKNLLESEDPLALYYVPKEGLAKVAGYYAKYLWIPLSVEVERRNSVYVFTKEQDRDSYKITRRPKKA